jgi:hypothetical protein
LQEVIVDEESLKTLISMGFKKEVCIKALKEKKNNFDEAIDYILSNPDLSDTYVNKNEENNLPNSKGFIGKWVCPQCTYENNGLEKCEMCELKIPAEVYDKFLNNYTKGIPEEKKEEKKVEKKKEEVKSEEIKKEIFNKEENENLDIEQKSKSEKSIKLSVLKDLEEAIYYCSITEAMEKSAEEKERGMNVNYYMEGGNGGRMYYQGQPRNNDGTYSSSENNNGSRNYYVPYMEYAPYMMRDDKWRSDMSRKMYMEGK